MWRMSYRNRLQRDLESWNSSGWVSDEGRAAILGSLDNEGGSHLATRAFILMGVLLFGSGVISFFASNWQEMSKLLKLALLFGSLWSSYLLAYFFGRNDDHPALHHALLLLGVILFGANIMLIAQIYHIDHHYPDGVMWWAIGGLITALLTRSQPAMVAALGLAVLWGAMEQFDFNKAIFWPVLIFILAALPMVVRYGWLVALRVAMIGLLFWSMTSYMSVTGWDSGWSKGSHVYLGQIYFLLYIGLYLLAGLYESYQHARDEVAAQMAIVRHFSAFAVLGSFYLLTFPDLLNDAKLAANGSWQGMTWLSVLLLAGLALWRYRREQGGAEPVARYIRLGFLLLVGLIAQVVMNLYFVHQMPGVMALSANLLYFATLLWLVFAGIHLRTRSLVNLAFFFFAVTLLTRYFDTFWSLMNRSFFFMGGGLVLIVGGGLLEKQRRRITAVITQQRTGGES